MTFKFAHPRANLKELYKTIEDVMTFDDDRKTVLAVDFTIDFNSQKGFSRPIIMMFVIYIGYLLVGSVCFVMLEAHNDTKDRKKVVESVRLFQAMIKNLKEANYSDSEIERAFTAKRDQLIRSIETGDIDWFRKYGEKVFFSFILISTIGYGNVTPKSILGMCTCVIYSIIGIPIHTIMMRLLSVGYRSGLAEIFKAGLKKFPGSRTVLIISGILFFLFFSVIFLFMPPYLIMFLEGWEYIQAFYFDWISLTTIGLGDYVAGVPDSDSHPGLYVLSVIITLVWLFFGSGFVLMSISMLSYLMGTCILTKLDFRCREKTEATENLKDLLELMKELNWQLVKGKPDDFKYWPEIEDFKNLLAENPEDVTLYTLQSMFEIILDLKEKAFEQVHQMQPRELAEVPTSFIQRHATVAEQESIPDILSATSVKVHKVKISASKIYQQYVHGKSAPLISESAPGAPEILEHKVDSDESLETESTSVLRFVNLSPNISIEDRRYSLDIDTKSDDEDVNSDQSEEKSSNEKRKTL